MQDKPAVRSLSSLPVPQINPTAFSARWTSDLSPNTHGEQSAAQAVTSKNDQVEIPSSPPISHHSLQIHEDDTATAPRSRINSSVKGSESPIIPTTKTSTSKNITNTNEQLSSPPLSQGEDEYEGDRVATVDPHADPEVMPASQSNDESNSTIKPRERRLTSNAVQGEAASGLLQLMRGGVVNVENMRGPMCGL